MTQYQKEVLSFIAKTKPYKEIEHLAQLFSWMDHNLYGQLSIEDLEEAYNEAEIQVDDIEEVFDRINFSNSGFI